MPRIAIRPHAFATYMQETYQPDYLARVGGDKGFIEAFYTCAALLYRLGLGLGLG